jgi:hypothetical protein
MFGLFMRSVGIPAVVLFLGFGGYSLYQFGQQEMIAKELYTWKPVVAMDYEIRELDSPKWPVEDVSLDKDSEAYQTWADKLEDMETAMQATAENEYTIEISYRYEYAGQVRNGFALSPFPDLNRQALRNPQLYRYLLRKDNPHLTVYVDPDDPTRSALVRGWAQGYRWAPLVIGGLLVPISLAMLYFLVRPVRRVEELFK